MGNVNNRWLRIGMGICFGIGGHVNYRSIENMVVDLDVDGVVVLMVMVIVIIIMAVKYDWKVFEYTTKIHK